MNEFSTRAVWCVAAGAALWSFRECSIALAPLVRAGFSASAREQRRWRALAAQLLTLEECLRAGVAVDEARWSALSGPASGDATAAFRASLVRIVFGLRERGARLLPTLGRARAMASFQAEELARAQAKSAAPRAQAGLATLALPGFAAVLAVLIPELQSDFWTWAAGVCALGTWGLVGWLWVQHLALAAQWGGMRAAHRPWLHAAPLGAEVFLASLQAGNPPDLAWSEMMTGLRTWAPALAQRLPLGLWEEPAGDAERAGRESELERRIVAWGRSLHQAVHVSLLEGRPCRERAELLVGVLQQEILAAVSRAVELLPTRALLPLFTCMAPALVGLLVWSFWLLLPSLGALE